VNAGVPRGGVGRYPAGMAKKTKSASGSASAASAVASKPLPSPFAVGGAGKGEAADDLAMAMLTSIPQAEYAARRAEVLKQLNGAIGVIFSGEGADPRHGTWAPDPFFYYLTGITGEQQAAVLFDPSHEDPTKRIVLFLRPLNPESDRWDAFRDGIGKSMRERLGFGTVMRTGHLPDMLTGAARRARKMACLHPFGNYNAPVSGDLLTFRKVQERIPGVSIDDRTEILRQMRSRKSPAEIAMVRHAIEITAAGLEAALRVLQPGSGEAPVAGAIENTYRQHGAHGPSGGVTAYNTIAGSGARGTLLHYRANDGPTDDGDLMVIDTGAQFAGYAADITRTYPVNGVFTSEQRDLYELVLTAQAASIQAARPGATMTDVNNASREVFDKRGMLDHFWHGIGHHLGLQVHDTDPGTPLQPGHLITIEPGLYIPERKIGIRIEDDILITRGGNENLSVQIPKTIKEIEAAMKG
jgi:Xaa-Pro aminopeptidase